jgi:hypothetical protein
MRVRKRERLDTKSPVINSLATTERYPLKRLSVGLSNTLELILLLDGVAVGRLLRGVDELISQALSDGLDVSESGLTGLWRRERKE